MEYYHILGVSSSASSVEIKKAYRQLVKKYHPDLNPSKEAQHKILEIREAYDVLINPYQRSMYDLSLNQGVRYEQFVQQEPVVDEREQRRKEYFRKKAREEREKYEHLLHVKIKFYNFQRKMSYVFLFIGLAFTVDYFFQTERKELNDFKMSINGYQNTQVKTSSGKAFATPGDKLYFSYNMNKPLYIRLSSIFGIPAYIEHDQADYKIIGTLFIFHNFFAYALLIISIILIGEKKYSDFSMTIGIIPWFFTLLLIALVLEETAGIRF